MMPPVSAEGGTLAVFFTYDYSLKQWHDAGIISREVMLYNSLSRQFQRVYLLTYGSLGEHGYRRRYLNENVEVLPNQPHLPAPLYSLLAPLIHRRALRRASVYRTHQVWGSWMAVMAKLLHGKKLVVRQGYQLSKFVSGHGAGLMKRLIVWFTELLAYRFADMIVVTSSGDRDYVGRRYGVSPARVAVIPSYLDTELFRPLEGRARDPRSIVFVGRLDLQKNLHSLLDAVKGLDVRLRIIGNGPLEEELKERARREGIGNVEFLGVIPNERLPEELNRSGLFVLPSLYEGSPKALLEAMACGLPVVGTNVEGIREVVRHRENGYLCGITSESLREAIETLVHDEELRGELSLRARRYVEENFSPEIVTESELRLYRGLT